MGPPIEYMLPMNSSPLPVARPWTPPDMDSDATLPLQITPNDKVARSDSVSDSGYFGECSDAPSDEHRDLWLLSPSPSPGIRDASSKRSVRGTGQTRGSSNKNLQVEERPYTPTRISGYGDAPMYPYTPDSSRIPLQRSKPFDAVSLLAPASWDSSPLDCTPTSPVQDALRSCLLNLERLIATSQPDAAQMEYIITQFEAMTSYLSAPEAQSKTGDEHLFAEPDMVACGETPLPLTKDEAEAYVSTVGYFIEGVKRHAAELKARLDEAKEINKLNVEVIANLRAQLRASKKTSVQLAQELLSLPQAPSQEEEESTPERKEPPRNSIWASAMEALDTLSNMLYEW